MTKQIIALLLSVTLLVGVAQSARKRGGQSAAVKANEKSLRLAVEDLTKTFPKRYPSKYLTRLNSKEAISDLQAFQREALLANPLLDDMKILAVKRNYGKGARRETKTVTPSIGAYSLAEVNPAAPECELIVISDIRQTPKISSLYKPKTTSAITEIDLNFDADKIMYTGVGSNGRWHIHEVAANGKYLRQLTPKDAEYHSFDSCYLPDGKVIFTSTAPIQGLPCEYGKRAMANIYVLDPKTSKIRRLTFEQDSNWGPSIMENGRVIYVRWEYSDTPHVFTRVVMTMNPDGTNQTHHYGSNSYWPTATHNPKQVPGKPSQFVGIVSGHHGQRPGPMVLFDVAVGRHEADGALQLFPGYAQKVKPVIVDGLYNGRYPKFLTPYPLGTSNKDGAGRYYLASVKPTGNSLWGVYLVDIYDNIVLISETDSFATNEPIPFAKAKKPPVLVDRTVPGAKEGVVYITDIYAGEGLKGLPRGSVKSIRLFAYHFAYIHAGSHEAIGIESSWDAKRLLGTVPVAADGSAVFKVPANTPIAIQPLDKNGASLQLMRSWFTAMPGEVVSCIGCHENQNDVPPVHKSSASRSKPVAISGKARNFSFLREVQPVLDRKCIGCHDGKKPGRPNFDDITGKTVTYPRRPTERGGAFSASYLALNPYVRRPGPESDYHLLTPMEYHSSTSVLTQMLTKGHHNVKLTSDEWMTINSWIDLNAPFWGTWADAHRNWGNVFHRNWAHRAKSEADHLALIAKSQALRKRLQKEYANIDEDYEDDGYTFAQAAKDRAARKPVMPPKAAATKAVKAPSGWPFVAKTGPAMEIATPGGKLAMQRIPAGKFVMGTPGGPSDEAPRVAEITKPFWMARTELTNAMYLAFAPKHDSGFIDLHGKDQKNRGINAKGADWPVIRVSQQDAVAFCKWLSEKTGKKFRLPTEAEWEFAARAGADTPMFYGKTDADFSKHANLADATIKRFDKISTYNYLLRVDSANDGAQVQTSVGKYQPNAFGLCDMIGNVAEWTSSSYGSTGQKVSRGGSWRDLPRWVPAGRRVPYQPYQRVYNVGIRVVMDD
ncbi:MAG: SUMF1/EgtB/PvdO family nonheme iron enzyme [Phycisphaerales bacterium]|nr:SUMF1/EgtB/PvdO family nonheme iron enzyme [Phycisphaerales bacterium]